MVSKNTKKKWLIVLLSILFVFMLNSLLLNLNFNQKSVYNDNSISKNDSFQDNNLDSQALSTNNIYSGIGSALNVTQWANRTDQDFPIRFNEGSYDLAELPLDNGWEGYFLDAQIKNLYDTRNWCNGSFSFGSDNGYQNPPANDSATITRISNNVFQNWTFHSYDNNSIGDAVINRMSGNYINSGGRDYFELRMNSGSRTIPGMTVNPWDGYDPGDICMWNSSFYINRGDAINCTLEFDVNPYYLADINTFALTVYINDQKIYSIGSYRLEQVAGGENNWLHIDFPQSKWKNQSNVFTGNLNESRVFISIALESSGSNMRVPHDESQIIYIDNVEFHVRSEVEPSQIGLKLNATNVNTIDYGKGYLQFDASANKWKSFDDKAYLNFSCTDTWDLSNFVIALNLDYNFFIIRNGLETNYETNQASYGTKYMVENNSLVNWEWYIYIQVPEGYIQKNMSIEFPADFEVTGVFNPTFPSDNIVSIPQVVKSTRGLLILKIDEISLTPDGFWKFEASSPNYCEDLEIFVDESGAWIENDTIISGDRLNIRTNITKSNIYVDLSNYIDKTYAQLLIKFPDGSVWASMTQYAKTDINGIVNFSSFIISNNPSSPEYIAGEYIAVITWNNSYNSFGINESGIITKKFIIQHDSILEPDENDYFFEDIVQGSSINIKVSFRDKLKNDYITGANVYALDPSKTKYTFTETSPGFYLYIFDTGTVSPGYLNLTVYANSSYYLNKQINITLDVIQETILSVDNDFLTDVQYSQNFTIRFNYTEKSVPTNLITLDIENEFTTDWAEDQWFVIKNADDTYNLTCNTTGYVPNIIHSFLFTVKAYQYESQTKEINVIINELDSKMEVIVNGTPFSTNDIYNGEVWQDINITARYIDINSNTILDGRVKVIGKDGLNENLTYIPTYNHFNIILEIADLAEGIDYLNILGESDNYKSSSLPFIVQITENNTIMEIFLNGANKTSDPSAILAYGASLNITVRYTDILGSFLKSADVKLSGDYFDNLIENSTLYQYSIILNSTNLAVGVKIIRLTAEKNNFETQLEDLRIEIRKIRTKVSIEEGDDKIEIKSDESIKIAIEILDLDNNVRITGAKVEYEWKLDDGEFDEESNGLYEVELKDIPEGTYTITILISKQGDQYEFESIEITLVVRESQEQTLLWQILLIIAIIISTAFLSYIIYYQKVLKYPKPVRKVRKYRKSLKKKSPPRINVIERDKAFNEKFSEQKKNISGLKSKTTTGILIKDKIGKKSTNKTSLKNNTKNQKKSSINEGNIGKEAPDKSKNQNIQKKSQNINKFAKENQTFSSKIHFRNKYNKLAKGNKLRLKKKFNGFSGYKRNRKIFFLSLILIFLFLNLNLITFTNTPNPLNNLNNNNDAFNFEENELKSQDLIFYDSIFNNSGIGAPWNVTYYANRTDTGVATFNNNSFKLLNVQSASGWTGYKLDATIRDLYDRRQWINGTMHYGGGDGTENVDEDDTNDIQDWIFFEVDPATGADMILTGNYINDSSAISNGHDCLEMRMDGDHFYDGSLGGDRWNWQTNTRCGWEYTINIPRGKVEDSSFAFDISPIHIAQYTNAWGVTVYINNYEILFIDLLDLNRIGEGNWGHIEFPQEAWTNSEVFPAQLDGTSTEIEIRLGYYGGSYSYGLEDGPHVDYQQVLIDNVELFIKAEALPTNVNLQMNQTAVNDIDFGTGIVELEGNWNGTENPFIKANFSSYGSGDYGGYQIEFNTDLNLYATKNVPDSYYETDTNSPGTYFTVSNGSSVYWEAYSYIATPTKYQQTEISVQFPTDLDITWVSTPQQPTINILSSCDNSIDGLLKIPTSLITYPSKPDGFWKILGISPNYCEQLNIFRNGTEDPLDNIWNQETSFFSGDYINITAKIYDYPEISDHIASTRAILQIRFPNGTIWQSANQLGTIDSNGNVHFNYFMIPSNPPNYQAGEYEAIITWNNSYSNRGLNETGLIYKKFTVIHNSILEPDDGNYLIENIIDDSIVNIKVSFRDKEDNSAITNAYVYTKNATEILEFSETSPGLYLYEYDTTKGIAGYNNISIFANSSHYINKQINITLDITKQTVLTVDNTYLSVPSNENFSIAFNYTELNSPETGIIDAELSTNWIDHTFSTISQGFYNLTCNTSEYEANTLYTLILTVKKYRNEPQSIAIRVYVSELGTSITLLVNDTMYSPNDIYTTEVWQDINITVRYKDSFGNYLSGANVTLLGKGKMDEINSNQYTIILNASSLAEGIDTLTIFANKSQYNPQTTQFIVEITERKTNIEIWLNGLNKTKDPFLELPIGQTMNIKINYTDSANEHVEDATVRLLGEGLNILLTEDKIAGIYSTTINTGTLSLGTKIFSIDASQNNYEPIVKNIRTNIRKVRTEVITEDEEKSYEIRPFEDFTLTIEVKNLDSGGLIEDAEVTYSWEFGDGDLKEVDDGVYEITFENVPEGSYTIEISVFKEGGEYDFNDLEITLTARRPEGESFLFLLLFIIAVSITVVLASYYVYYRKVLRFPKPVRKVRKYRRSLKKKSAPSIDIIEREKGFKKVYSEELGKTSKSLKSKAPAVPTVLEKIEKKPVSATPSEGIKKKTIAPSKTKNEK